MSDSDDNSEKAAEIPAPEEGPLPIPNWVFAFDEEGQTIPFAYGLTKREARAAAHARCQREGISSLGLYHRNGRLYRFSQHDDDGWDTDFTTDEVSAIVDSFTPDQMALYMEAGERMTAQHATQQEFIDLMSKHIDVSVRILPRWACVKVLDDDGLHFHYIAVADTKEMAFKAAAHIAELRGIDVPGDWGVIPLMVMQAIFCMTEYCEACSYEPTTLAMIRRIVAETRADDERVNAEAKAQQKKEEGEMS